MRAYPRHTVNLSADCYRAAIGALARGRGLSGPDVNAFEREFARFIGVDHAVAVSSGRAALAVTLSALDLAPGDEVIVPAYTFHVVPLVVHACGLTPVFVDVRADTWNIDTDRLAEKVTPRTRAIVATHMYGQPCDLEPVLRLADAHGLALLEDCAHACGAAYGGRRVGSLGHAGLFTFALAKNMPCFGGGMITTSDAALAGRLRTLVRTPGEGAWQRLLRDVAATSFSDLATRGPVFTALVFPLMRLAARFGRSALDRPPGEERVSPDEVRHAYRDGMTNLQAAVGRRQLLRLDATNAMLNRHAALYANEFNGADGIGTPHLGDGRTATFLYYRLRVAERDLVRQHLRRAGVDTAPDDMSDCSRLPPFSQTAGEFPVASGLPDTVLEIPINSRLDSRDIRRIAAAVKEAVAAPRAREECNAGPVTPRP